MSEGFFVEAYRRMDRPEDALKSLIKMVAVSYTHLMALHKQDFTPYREDSSRITCQKISTKEDFISWIDVVNTALHGWNMIDAEHYFSWVKSDNIKIYSAKINGITVSTCATIQNGNTASLEFVSTLEQYRRRKAALLCSCAINDLLKNGVEIVTLSACGESVYLYEGLG